ncbi:MULTISPECIES: hypothetical protein [Pseudomonas syringae group]|nr:MULTISPECIES: hypothetical protein [Pseudomonas syringae group]
MTIIKHATNPAIFVGTSDEFDTAQDGEFSASGLWFFYVCGKEGGLACLSAEDAMQAGEKEFFRRTENEIEWECRFAEPEDIPAAALEYLLTTGGDAQEMRSEDQTNLEQLAADQADDPRRKLAKEYHVMDADQLLLGLLRGLRK